MKKIVTVRGKLENYPLFRTCFKWIWDWFCFSSGHRLY